MTVQVLCCSQRGTSIISSRTRLPEMFRNSLRNGSAEATPGTASSSRAMESGMGIVWAPAEATGWPEVMMMSLRSTESI